MPDCLLPPTTSEPSVPVQAVAAADLDRFVANADKTTSAWISANDFKAAAGSVLMVPGPDGGVGSVLLGLGDPGSNPRAPLLPGVLASKLKSGVYRLVDGFDDPSAATLAFALGAYRYGRYRSAAEAPPRLVVPDGITFDTVNAIADGVWLARDLINTAPNDMGPPELAAAAKSLAGQHGADYAETVGGALLSANFPMIHAVGAAAAPSRAPRLVDFSWGDPEHPKITLVGKGVCFDTGGLDIKPASGMLLMKKDMAGAANVLGLAHMIMACRLPVRLRVLIPAVENAISGAAFRPGDVLTSRKGLTVEIGNTDAEGRLVLADALTLASEEDPDLIVDLATLTGAARTALGPEVTAFFANDDALATDFTNAGETVSDPVWRLPLWAPYMAMLDSKFADINNAGATPFAGSITAALFLSRFVDKNTDWIHGDIYGWNRSAEPGRPYGGEAMAIRALFAMISERYQAS
jgi:leucyl aminopeptidase